MSEPETAGDVREPALERPELRASAGIAWLGSHVAVHGLDLHADCLQLGFVHYLLFCVTGRRFEPVVARALEELWISTGYPDARIWCNRVAGYLGSARVDPALALAASLAATNSVAYGFQALHRAYRVQASLPEPLGEREDWLGAVLARRRVLHGYGRPVHGHDERIDVALEILARAGLPGGPALRRAFWLERRLHERKGLEMNIAAVFAAIAIDPMGRYFATGDSWGMLKIWKAADGELVASQDAGYPISSVKFAPDGRTIVAARQDDSVSVWRLTE